MSLSQKQRRFTRQIGHLIQYASSIGYGLTFGDCYRSELVKYGHKNSTHRSRLAVDFNVFEADEYLQGSEAAIAHNKLHDYWDLLGGAERIDNDLNHYSFEHNGVR